MTEILTLISATTAAIVAIIHAWKAPQARAVGRETRDQVQEMGKALNGRLVELLEATREVGWQAGFREGRQCTHCPLTRPPEPPDAA